MSDLLVECPIHLDAVPINDILVFKCGHGFCEPCLEEHFAHRGHSCPTCRKPVRRREAFPLFLAPGQPSTSTQAQSSRSTADQAAHTQLTRELMEAQAAHASCSDRIHGLQDEIDTLRQDNVRRYQALELLRGRYEVQEERLTAEAAKSARGKEAIIRLKEDVTKLQVENHRATRDRERALMELQAERERVRLLQGYNEQYKHKYNLEKKKRKAIESTNHPPPKEDESFMIVDANAPDMLHQDGPDFGWLDEACKVKGDRVAIPGDENLEFRESEDELLLDGSYLEGEQRENRAPTPPLHFSSAWNPRVEIFGGPSSSTTRKRKHGSKLVGGSKIVKVRIPVTVGAQKLVGGPLAIDREGRIKGTVTLGSRQRLNSKN